MRDKSKWPRNELRFSFCIPSSCTNEDLRQSLHDQLVEYVNKTEFVLDLEMNEKSCQVNEEMSLSTADKCFM